MFIYLFTGVHQSVLEWLEWWWTELSTSIEALFWLVAWKKKRQTDKNAGYKKTIKIKQSRCTAFSVHWDCWMTNKIINTFQNIIKLRLLQVCQKEMAKRMWNFTPNSLTKNLLKYSDSINSITNTYYRTSVMMQAF